MDYADYLETGTMPPPIETDEEKRRKLGASAGGLSVMPPAYVNPTSTRDLATQPQNRSTMPPMRLTPNAPANSVPDKSVMPPMRMDAAQPPASPTAGQPPTMPPMKLNRPAIPNAEAASGAMPAGRMPAANVMPPAPVNPAQKRYEDLQAQGEPKLSWWKRALDLAGSLHPLGQEIEAQIPGSPQNYSMKLNQAAVRAAKEQELGKGQLEQTEARQRIEKGASAAQFDTPEKRRQYMAAHPNEFEGVDDFEKNDFTLSGKFPQREPVEKPHDVVKQYSDALAAGDDAKAAELLPRVKQFIENTDKSKGPTPSGEDKAISDHLAANNLQDTPANRDKARKDLKLQDRVPPQGSFTPIYDPKTGALTSFYDATTGVTRPAPSGGGTTSQGIAQIDKKAAAEDKKNEPFQNVLDKEAEAKEFAAEKTGPGDIGLILAVVEATRPKAGFRMTQVEWNMIQHSRSSLGNVQALLAKVETGALLTPEQRQQMLDTIGVVSKMARKRLSGTGGQSDAEQTSSSSDAVTDLIKKHARPTK
jgi:hypothetical protein